jgi:hypothetical protein
MLFALSGIITSPWSVILPSGDTIHGIICSLDEGENRVPKERETYILPIKIDKSRDVISMDILVLQETAVDTFIRIGMSNYYFMNSDPTERVQEFCSILERKEIHRLVEII